MKFFTATLVVVLFLFTSFPVLAHLPGQPPFFKINGEYSPLYTVPTTSLSDFALPQDIGPKNYLVGERLNFEIDTTILGVPEEIVEKTEFSWDFGDGVKAAGIKNTHLYSKPGSYILVINAKTEEVPIPQIIQSVMLNILPSKEYNLPQAVINVNGWGSKDPLTDIYISSFDKEFNFDASKSKMGSSKIVEYIWDFGDGQRGEGEKATHKYRINPYAVFPVLRTKDENGFISDNFIQISEKKGSTDLTEERDKSNNIGYILGIIVAVPIFLVIIYLVYRKLKE